MESPLECVSFEDVAFPFFSASSSRVAPVAGRSASRILLLSEHVTDPPLHAFGDDGHPRVFRAGLVPMEYAA